MLKSMFSQLKKDKKAINEDRVCGSDSYVFQNTVNIVRNWLEVETNTKDKIILLDFVMNSIRMDLQYDTLTTILYSKEHFKKDLPSFFLPYYYYNEKGEEIEILESKDLNREVDLSNDCVIVLPWDRVRLRDSIRNIGKNPFEYKANNHFARYYSLIDICYVHNGLHSVTAGVGHKKGRIKAHTVSVEKMFEHLDTNGKVWINTHTKEVYNKVFDFRFAILYELARMKFRIEQ